MRASDAPSKVPMKTLIVGLGLIMLVVVDERISNMIFIGVRVFVPI